MSNIDTFYSEKQLAALNKMLANEGTLRKAVENDILGIQISNAQKLFNLKKELLAKEKADQENLIYKINEARIKAEQNIANQRKKEIQDYKKQLAKATTGKEKDKIKKEHKDKLAAIKEENKLLMKGLEDRIKKEDKAEKERKKAEQIKDIAKDKSLSKQEKINKLQTEAGLSQTEADRALRIMKLSSAINALSSFAKQLDSTVNDIAGNKSAIDTRLQGSKRTNVLGSYWEVLNSKITSVVGLSPLVKQADVVTNLKTMVGQGIAFNVEQRAFLQTVKDKIATTFDALDGSLLKLVRIQQQDTTAARLGMESALTAFLNNMYETTEYMQSAAADIRAQIYEASALMTAKSATEFEYQVQKWMGSLYSAGFSNTSGLSGALGKLVAGDISGISEGGFGNLLVMAANRSNKSIADILATGLDASETNELMQAMVTYLGQIYAETKGSNILAQQYAGVFGLTASDLKAAANLAGSVSGISKQNLNYGGMMTQLNSMANSMYARTSTGELLTNMYENLKYGLSASIANNPVLYAIWAASNILDDTVNGIEFGTPLVMGTGMTQTFKVSDIMKTGALGGSLLGFIPKLIAGIATGGGGGFWGSSMLNAFGVNGNNANIFSKGTSGLLTTSGATTSESGSIIGNADTSSITGKTMTDATDSANAQVAQAAEESTETKLSDVDANIIKIYQLLENVTNGTQTIKVDMGNEAAWGTIIRDNQRY